jgi:hypothetical protein
MMFECWGCHKVYEVEEEAIKCCTEVIEYDDGDFILPRKLGGKPYAKTHNCPNVKHGDKSWSVLLGVDEKCPMCDYAYRAR